MLYRIYNSMKEIPDDVLKSEICEFEKIYKECKSVRLVRLHLQMLKDELAQRQSDSLYVTNPDGTVELVDDIGEIK